MTIQFDVAPLETAAILEIVARMQSLTKAVGAPMRCSRLELAMDLTACHANGCPLDLGALLQAPDADFAHDVWGIRRHLDRDTGQLGDGFYPRYARR
jgi:hypothetical protein